MSELKQVETTTTTLKNSLDSDLYAKASVFFSNYAHKDNFSRILIQAQILSILFSIITIIAVVKSFSIKAMFTAYISCSIILIVFDRFILNRPAFLRRKVYLLDLASEHLSALSLLEKLGPKSKQVIKIPIFVYHQLKALILAHSGQYNLAEAETFSAQEAGLSIQEIASTRANIYRSLGDFNKAQQEITSALAADPPSISLRMDLALLLIQAREYRPARRVVREIQGQIKRSFIQRDPNTLVLDVLFGICKLWTGHAEEGTESLRVDLEELYLYSLYKEEMRPLTSWCFLERAYYHTTHKEPELAINDLKIAKKLCLYPEHQQKVAEINEEFKMRHNI